ncbi:MAG: hypothetical protein GY718_14555 [Lentisphaerae bacterium]|nr:hypothetical protein [Lentisphaerota bacterium]
MEDNNIDIEEGSHREELVCQEDISKISTMNKNGLEVYAHSRLDAKLDLTRKLKELRIQVITLVKKKLDLPTGNTGDVKDEKEVPLKKQKPEFVLEPKRRRVFEATDMLLKRTDLIPVWLIDKDGKKL